MFKIGTPVIYKMTKFSTQPGPRASNVHPASQGDSYGYTVDKLWVVVEVNENEDKVIIQTRRGKTREIDVDDPNLRRASWWERIWYRNRFPQLAG